MESFFWDREAYRMIERIQERDGKNWVDCEKILRKRKEGTSPSVQTIYTFFFARLRLCLELIGSDVENYTFFARGMRLCLIFFVR